MRALLDTSVLVAALVRSHPESDRCRSWLAKVRNGETDLVMAAHSLAELHVVLTTLPVKPRISPRTALRLSEENGLRPTPTGLADVVALTAEDYVAVIEAAAERSLAGGILYDALIAKAAEKAGVDALVTLNAKHFRRAWPAGLDRVREP